MDIFNLNNPPLRILYSLKAVLLAHIFYNFPLAIRIISSVWHKIPNQHYEASYSLGANRIRTFFKITLPYLIPPIFTSLTLIFLYCFMSFGIILILGGGPTLSTIEVEVYRFARISLNIEKAASLSFIESTITIAVLFFYLKNDKKNKNLPLNSGTTKKLTKKMGVVLALYLIPLGLIILAPLITIVVQSFLYKSGFSTNNQISLHWYKSLFGTLQNRFTLTALMAIKNSLILGFSTVIITIPMALSVTYNIHRNGKHSTFYKLLFFMPMGISSIIIGLSYLSFNLPKSYILIIFAHSVISLPLAIRSISNVYQGISISTIEAATSLGAGRLKTFIKIELPQIKTGIVTAAIFSFAISMGEMNASIMLAPSNFVTIPLAIYQLIGSYNFYGACALGSILLLISLLSFKLIDNFD